MIKTLILLLLLFIPIVTAYSTFFDNSNDAFIMGSSTSSSPTIGGETTGGSAQESGTSGDGQCLTNWKCSSWFSCTNGTQIRNCTREKVNCYADLKMKPSEIQNCPVEKAKDKNNTGSKDRIKNFLNKNDGNVNNSNSSSVKVIILGMFIVIVIGVIVLFAYKRYFV
ncbi:MAG: hypothetical protein AABX19_01810 [Nanoarchaeota archaeon]